MRPFLPILVYLVFIGILVTSDLRAVPDRPKPMQEEPPVDLRTDPLAIKILRAGYQKSAWEAAVENAEYKLLVIDSSGYYQAIAASELVFRKDGSISANVFAMAQWTKGSWDRIGTMTGGTASATTPTTIVFDRPIRTLQDFRGAKIRGITWGAPP